FSVSEDKQVYHCFGCKRSGQIFTALQELKGMTFPEAVEYLASRAGIPLPADVKVDRPELEKSKAKKAKLLKMNEVAMKFYADTLAKAPTTVKSYVNSRGLSAGTVSAFRIGYAPPEWESLTGILTKLKAPLE